MPFFSSLQIWMSVRWAPTTAPSPRPATTSRAASAACALSAHRTTSVFPKRECPSRPGLALHKLCGIQGKPCLDHFLLCTAPSCLGLGPHLPKADKCTLQEAQSIENTEENVPRKSHLLPCSHSLSLSLSRAHTHAQILISYLLLCNEISE